MPTQPAARSSGLAPTSGDLDTASNWSTDAVPTSSDDVIIGSGVTLTHNVSDTDSVQSLNCAGTLSIGGGSLSLGSASSITNLTLQAGATITGAGDLEIEGTMNWAGGTMSGSGTTTIDAAASLNFQFAGYSVDTNQYLNRDLDNAGTATLTGGDIVLGSGVTLDNQSGALFDAQTDASITTASGSATFSNEGTVKKSAGTGITSIGASVTFNTSGEVDAQTGTLQLSVGSNSGVLDLSSGATVSVVLSGSGAFVLASGSSYTGTGVLSVGSAGIVELDTDVTLNNLDLLSTSQITGTGNLSIEETMNWSGGTVSGSGTLTIDTAAALNLPITPHTNHFLNRNLNNAGTATLTGIGIFMGNGVTLDNQAGALFDDQIDALISTHGSGSATFLNEGVFQKDTSSGTTTIIDTVAFDNTGEVDVLTGTLDIEGAGSNSTAIDIASGAVLQLDSAAGFTLESTSDISGAGSVMVNSGTLNLGGNIVVSGGLTIQSGATVVGSASITASVSNNGTLTVGTSTAPGSISITGDYTQGSSASLNLILGGLTAGTGFSQLNISGTATLAGTLNVSLTSSYTPSGGNSFQVLTFGSSSGTFGSIYPPSGISFTPSYNSADLTLQVVLLSPEEAEDNPFP